MFCISAVLTSGVFLTLEKDDPETTLPTFWLILRDDKGLTYKVLFTYKPTHSELHPLNYLLSQDLTLWATIL